MSLRVLAIAAPYSISGRQHAAALQSADPASLFNACRIAGARAKSGSGVWADSNWNVEHAELRRLLPLMYSLDELGLYASLLLKERPNLLLIGAMALGMPGAIECARLAKALFGDAVTVVLGGRHPTESIYLSNKRDRRASGVRHHVASPISLMGEGAIPPVFDLVVSGDGENLIAALGEVLGHGEGLGRCTPRGPAALETALAGLDVRTPGDWIVAWRRDGVSRAIVSAGVPINRQSLPSIATVFGVSAGFDVFGGRKTAHAFSDTGPGCAYDCAFCSEASSVTGGIQDAAGAPQRLHGQLAAAQRAIASEHGVGASAFVEDSVLLGGSAKLIDRFVDRMMRDPVDIVFGAQLTIDQILSRGPEIARLRQIGLRYLFIGVETLEPEAIGGMSKDLNRSAQSWVDRLRAALDLLGREGVRCGAAVLFGLGETHRARILLLETLGRMRDEFGSPDPISANWAVQHPLRGRDGGANYRYCDWGTPEGPLLDCFHEFGEASLRYPLLQAGPPALSQVQEVTAMLRALSGAPALADGAPQG